MSCSDILLSFLADVGEDWTDSFIFPDSETSLVNVDDYLNKSEYSEPLDYQKDLTTIEAAEYCSTDSSSYDVDSTDSDDVEFQNALDMFEMSEDFDTGISTDEMFGEVEAKPVMVDEVPVIINSEPEGECGSKKRKLESPVVMMPKKSTKVNVLAQVRDVCGLLKSYRIHQFNELEAAKHRKFRVMNPLGSAEAYLNAVFGSTAATPQDLLKLSSPVSTFQCKALSSLVGQSQIKKTQMKLSAWAPLKNQSAAFPESHVGIGQIAAASRAFTSSIAEILSHSIMQKLKFSVQIPTESAICSKYGDQLSAPFLWKSEGMISMGYSSEFEFNGLIRCSFARDGISAASVTFDACKIVRQQEDVLQPQSASVGVL